MEITDVRMKLMNRTDDRLKAYGSITLGGEFVIRDVKVVEGTHGLFVAMPSRKVTLACPRCAHKNYLRARFCNECGGKLTPRTEPTDPAGATRMHRDIAHPITPAFREVIQTRVLEAYRVECERAVDPAYSPADLPPEIEAELDSEVDVGPQASSARTAAPPSPPPAQAAPPPPVPAPRHERPLSDDSAGGFLDEAGAVLNDDVDEEVDSVPAKPDDELSEYDALIAGLNRGDGGPRSAAPRGGSQPPSRPPVKPERGPGAGNQRGGRRGGGRHGTGQDSGRNVAQPSGPRGQSRPQRPAEHARVGAADSAGSAKPAPQAPFIKPEPERPVPSPPPRQAPPPRDVAPPPPPIPQPVKPATTTAAAAPDLPFGAGIG